jgi:Holliday junction resolvase
MEILEMIRKANAERGKENRQRGEAFEFKILRDLKKKAIFAIRSAGSHSIVDLYALLPGEYQWFISVKTNGYWHPKEIKELRKLQTKLPKKAIIKIAYYVSPKKYTIETFK